MALIVTTCPNTLKTSDKPFFIRSVNSGVIEIDELTRLMAEDNTTLTAADTSACLQVMSDIVCSLLADGNKVRTPFGLLYLSASGGVQDRMDAFTPRNAETGHRLALRYRQDASFAARVLSCARIKRQENFDTQSPVIYRVTGGEDVNGKALRAGDIVKIHGLRLAIDAEDDETGIFLTDSTGNSVRADKYFYIRPSVLIAKLPDNLAAGDCTVGVSVKNKSGVIRSCKENGMMAIAA